MIQEDYVSFEAAKLMKEKGFQQKQDNSGYYATEMVYCVKESEDGSHHFCHQYPACCDQLNEYICAPTIQMAMKWLREVHKLHIEFVLNQDVQNEEAAIENYYFFNVSRLDRFANEGGDCKSYKSYEEACQSAIKYCLENLI